MSRLWLMYLGRYRLRLVVFFLSFFPFCEACGLQLADRGHESIYCDEYRPRILMLPLPNRPVGGVHHHGLPLLWWGVFSTGWCYVITTANQFHETFLSRHIHDRRALLTCWCHQSKLYLIACPGRHSDARAFVSHRQAKSPNLERHGWTRKKPTRTPPRNLRLERSDLIFGQILGTAGRKLIWLKAGILANLYARAASGSGLLYYIDASQRQRGIHSTAGFILQRLLNGKYCTCTCTALSQF